MVGRREGGGREREVVREVQHAGLSKTARGRKGGRETEREVGRRKGEREESAGFGGMAVPFLR